MTQKRLKVLFATIPQPKNRFVGDLQEGIGVHAEVVYNYEEFWACKNHYDVVHIHEPEYLSYEIEACMNHTDPIPKDLWDRLIASLEHWKKRSKIIHTRHVQEPHVRTDDEFKNLYKTVFSYCDGVAHFANFSIEQFESFYPELQTIKHVVIPHQNYRSLPNDISRDEARKKMHIANNANVMLVFGMIKEREKHLITTAFNAIPGANKVLLAPGWKVSRRTIKWIRLREWVYKFDLWRAKQNRNFRTNLGFVQEADAQYYLNASDILLIPRIDELNSGNITLGCTFGLVVTGRDGGDIGEILTETGNPVFNPNESVSVAVATKKAFELAAAGHGQRNQHLAMETWRLEQICEMYFDLYQQLTNTVDS
jgi:hypothetical protein